MTEMEKFFSHYSKRLQIVLARQDWAPVAKLGKVLRSVAQDKRRIYICGNGGSAANAIHMANDLITSNLQAEALAANQSVMTCLANDFGYGEMFSRQLEVVGRAGDILIALSGSGNSENVVRAISTARELRMETCGVFGFDGGKALQMVHLGIHFPVDDMEISEDLQLVVGHMLSTWLKTRPLTS